ncbi:zinc-dependent alcohol dehydrogenase [Defluviimonas sp. SAOS-178_SWC]|uniref:zinc-dependent alcohol dehydrogenase n=1 Tax=Defluviimonas sp. SAOS-178_SWC TaxID=3121287 RepID=UPI0032217EDC
MAAARKPHRGDFTMLSALRKIQAGPGIAITPVAAPVPAAGEVLLDVTAAGVCGSDLHVDEWTSNYGFMADRLPVTLGHEFGGTVIAAGPDKPGRAATPAPGSRVVVVPFRSCGDCPDCARGDAGACQKKQAYLGFVRDGGFCSRVTVPVENCLIVPTSLDDEALALIEPLTIGAQAVARSNLSKGARVLVVGPGPIGHSIALMAEAAGAAMVAIAGKDDAVRLSSLNANGFDATIDIGTETLDGAVRARMGDAPFDVVFDAVGAPQIFEPALRLLANGGCLVTAGLPARAVPLDLTTLSRNQQSIIGSHRAPPAIWKQVIATVAASPERFTAMISHRVPLREGARAFELSRSRQSSKVILTMP